MKKYVFLTQSISGITGNQRYVNNKCKLLRQNGWEVIVFWNYNISPVQLEYVKCFDEEKYIHHELKFYPSWFSKRSRNKVIDRLVSVIGTADQIVIESNKLELGAWGELLAQRLNCKHINFVTSEGITILNKATFDYCYEKLKKKEFFNINPAAVEKFFSLFTTIENPENFYWSASPGVEVEEYEFPLFDDLPAADSTITSFGRRKEYFPYMLGELNLFASRHPDKSFNLFFLGALTDESEITNNLTSSNINLAIYPREVKIVPKQMFTKSDVIIATAGCASLASSYGVNVIAMDVTTSEPLGLLKRTTLDSNTYSGKYKNDKSISQWLESILIKKDTYPKMQKQKIPHRFDYQMQFIDQCDHNYIDTSKVREKMTQHDGMYEFLVKIGLFHLVEYFYFKRRGVKVIWR